MTGSTIPLILGTLESDHCEECGLVTDDAEPAPMVCIADVLLDGSIARVRAVGIECAARITGGSEELLARGMLTANRMRAQIVKKATTDKTPSKALDA